MAKAVNENQTRNDLRGFYIAKFIEQDENKLEILSALQQQTSQYWRASIAVLEPLTMTFETTVWQNYESETAQKMDFDGHQKLQQELLRTFHFMGHCN